MKLFLSMNLFFPSLYNKALSACLNSIKTSLTESLDDRDHTNYMKCRQARRHGLENKIILYTKQRQSIICNPNSISINVVLVLWTTLLWACFQDDVNSLKGESCSLTLTSSSSEVVKQTWNIKYGSQFTVASKYLTCVLTFLWPYIYKISIVLRNIKTLEKTKLVVSFKVRHYVCI